ncbi:hypothetical protein [Chitinophaga qingshengii]|uniref:Uncharacterized protein n=1 Tax=Chitinophaga qingshengii TaxID=1569794 RepID=A0ABR7TRC7_9BACT|nr:hypothetical protein [Chitinophaga qingshengii]MBC9932112.1 hypothetical protein [Chitinophaga qingshengii]
MYQINNSLAGNPLLYWKGEEDQPSPPCPYQNGKQLSLQLPLRTGSAMPSGTGITHKP